MYSMYQACYSLLLTGHVFLYFCALSMLFLPSIGASAAHYLFLMNQPKRPPLLGSLCFPGIINYPFFSQIYFLSNLNKAGLYTGQAQHCTALKRNTKMIQESIKKQFKYLIKSLTQVVRAAWYDPPPKPPDTLYPSFFQSLLIRSAT